MLLWLYIFLQLCNFMCFIYSPCLSIFIFLLQVIIQWCVFQLEPPTLISNKSATLGSQKTTTTSVRVGVLVRRYGFKQHYVKFQVILENQCKMEMFIVHQFSSGRSVPLSLNTTINHPDLTPTCRGRLGTET